MGYWCRLSTQILVLMHMDPVLGLQGHLDVLFLTFWGTAMFLSIMSTLICIPLYYKRALASPHFHQTFVIFLIFFYNHSSNRYDAIIIGLSSYCSFRQVDKLLKKTPQLRNCLYWISLWACLRDILFIDGLCGRAQLTVCDATPGMVVLDRILATRSKPVAGFPPRPLLGFLPPKPLLEFLPPRPLLRFLLSFDDEVWQVCVGVRWSIGFSLGVWINFGIFET